MKTITTGLLVLLSLPLFCAAADKQVAYIYGDVAADGTTPSGTGTAAYDPMLLSDTGNKGCSQFKAMVEAQGYSIAAHYDATTTLSAEFLAPFDVVVFGLHQKVWSAAETAALDTWLRAGGGILMYSDSAAGGFHRTVGIKNTTGQTAVNTILSAYGMQVTVDQGGGTRAYRPEPDSPHPILWDRPVFEGEGVSPIAIDSSSGATALIPLDAAHRVAGNDLSLDARNVTISNPIWAVIAHQRVDAGNIIAIFDRQPMWNNGPGSDINEEDNKEILRRIIRYLARDYGNSSEWLGLTADQRELTYRQWSNDRNTHIAVEVSTNLLDAAWQPGSNRVEHVSSTPEAGGETEQTTVRLIADAEHEFARVAIVPATNAPPSPSVLAINCGGTAFTGNDGTLYQADAYYVGGHTDTFPNNPVAGTDDDALYNYARSNFSAYQIPVANGSYTVKLQFAETFFSAANQRVFDLWIEGAPVLDDLDLVATAPGKWVAYDRTFSTTVSDGMLSITASSSVNHALLNAIVITKK